MKVKFSFTKENWEKKGKLSLGDAALKKINQISTW